MKTLIAAFFISLIVSSILTPWIRRLAPKLGAVDLPSGRRVNKRIIPRLGGIAIAVGFLSPLIGLLFFDNKIADLFREDLLKVLGLCVGAVIICALGALDDWRGVRARHKLYVQIGVASFAYWCGFQIDAVHLPFLGDLEMGIFAFPFTLFWIVGIINALNLIDGLDGLAGGLAFSACVVNIVVGLVSGNLLATLLAIALAGALLGFLVFNFNPASIFMGDSGSMFLGYVLGVSALFGFKGTTAIGLLVPILALGVPILDTLTAIARRVISRRPIFASDRHHFHHRLLELGLTHRRAVLSLYAISALLTGASILVYVGKDWVVGLTLLGTVVGIGVFIRVVGTLRTPDVNESNTELLEVWRQVVPEAILGFEKIENESDLWTFLESFSEKAGLYHIRCSSNEGKDWLWEAPEAMADEGMRGYVTCEFKFWTVDKSDRFKLHYGWYCDSGKVQPENHILLQLITDGIERVLSRRAEEGRLQLVEPSASV